jgi:hypothetical protein
MDILTAPPADFPALAGRVFPDDYPPVNTRGITLRPVPQDVRLARRFALGYCDSRGISVTAAGDISVCLSELVTNAVRHARFPAGRPHIFVQIRQHGPFVLVRVFDPDWQHLPVVAVAAGVGAESGRGLSSIVSALACRLEFGPAPHRLKVVAFTVDCLPSKSL